MQRSFLGQVMTTRACPRCGGLGSVIEHPCGECGGDGRVRARRTLTVKIPAGVENGMRIRLTGEGEVGPGGGPAGDLYVEVVERPHPVFTRDGDDLHCTVTAPDDGGGARHDAAARDARRRGDARRRTPARSPTRCSRCAPAACPHLRGTGRGDLHVHLEVQVPTRLDAKQEELLRDLARLRGEERPGVSGKGGLFGRRKR